MLHLHNSSEMHQLKVFILVYYRPLLNDYDIKQLTFDQATQVKVFSTSVTPVKPKLHKKYSPICTKKRYLQRNT